MFVLDGLDRGALAARLARLMVNIESGEDRFDPWGRPSPAPRPGFVSFDVPTSCAGAAPLRATYRPVAGVVYYLPGVTPNVKKLIAAVQVAIHAEGYDHLAGPATVAATAFVEVVGDAPAAAATATGDEGACEPCARHLVLRTSSSTELAVHNRRARFVWTFRSAAAIPYSDLVTTAVEFNSLVASVLINVADTRIPLPAGGRAWTPEPLLEIPRDAFRSRRPRPPDDFVRALARFSGAVVVHPAGVHLVPHMDKKRLADDADPACWRPHFRPNKWKRGRAQAPGGAPPPATLVGPAVCGVCLGPLRGVVHAARDSTLADFARLPVCPPCFECGGDVDRLNTPAHARGARAEELPAEFAVFRPLLAAEVTPVAVRAKKTPALLRVRQANGVEFYVRSSRGPKKELRAIDPRFSRAACAGVDAPVFDVRAVLFVAR